MELNTTEEIIADIRQGKMVILMDDEARENEGDLIIAAERVRTEDINFMATNARGLICLTLTQERCQFLDLPLMVNENNTPYNTSFTISIEAASGVTTGISAADRARTIQVAVGRESQAMTDFAFSSGKRIHPTHEPWWIKDMGKQGKVMCAGCGALSHGPQLVRMRKPSQAMPEQTHQ